MIRGVVSRGMAAVVGIEIHSLGIQKVEAVVDTGFNGALSLPSALVRALRLPHLGVRDGILADGSAIEFDTYLATILWNGKARVVVVLESDGGNLIGTELLRDCRLIVDYVPDGVVSIDSIA